MTDSDVPGDIQTGAHGGALAQAEIELRRYEARLGVWKVVLGTFIVGLAGIIIPAAINLTTLFFESWREEARFQLEKQTAHQQYIKDFFDTAVNQDVELRIRFAKYFANLSDGEQKMLWQTYLDELEREREASRDKINALESRLLALQKIEQNLANVTELDRVARELNWTYAEIGYVPLDRSVVQVAGGKKERLYAETLDVIARLLEGTDPVDPRSLAYSRFWELHDRDLIGVESRTVATRMIAFGRALRSLADQGDPPNDYLTQLAGDVRIAMQRDLEVSEVPDTAQRGLVNLRQLAERPLVAPSLEIRD